MLNVYDLQIVNIRGSLGMRCLECGSYSWSVHYGWVDAYVDNKLWSIKAKMYKCNYCDQTSADSYLMGDIISDLISLSGGQKHLYPTVSREDIDNAGRH